MRLTLLEMVQHILSAMGSDEVSNYDDTVESYQVALLIKQAFYDCAVELGLPEHDSLFQLTASGDNTKPCLMSVPNTVTRLDQILYDNKGSGDTTSDYKEVKWMDFDAFLRMQQALDGAETSYVGEQVVSNNSQSFNIKYRSDMFPTFFTSPDNSTIIFDGYNSDVDTTLASAKTMCYGAVYPSFTLSNSAYPDLDATQFPYLLAKAKTRAFMELKQQPNQESAAESRKQKIIVQKRKNTIGKDPAIYDVFRSGRK